MTLQQIAEERAQQINEMVEELDRLVRVASERLRQLDAACNVVYGLALCADDQRTMEAVRDVLDSIDVVISDTVH